MRRKNIAAGQIEIGLRGRRFRPFGEFAIEVGVGRATVFVTLHQVAGEDRSPDQVLLASGRRGDLSRGAAMIEMEQYVPHVEIDKPNVGHAVRSQKVVNRTKKKSNPNYGSSTRRKSLYHASEAGPERICTAIRPFCSIASSGSV